MKEDPILETFPQLMSKAYGLGWNKYIAGEGDALRNGMIGTLFQGLHWLHKDYRIHMLVGPISREDGIIYGICIVQCEGNLTADIEHEKDDEYYEDWIEAHVEGLKVCLDLVHQIKQQQNENRPDTTGK